MLQAIVTKSFQYPDGDFGITVTAQWGTATHAHDPSFGIESAHREAATQFAIDRGWLGGRDPDQRHSTVVGGAMPDGLSFCWVIVERQTQPQWPSWLPETVLSMEHDHNPAVRSYGNLLRKRMEAK